MPPSRSCFPAPVTKEGSPMPLPMQGIDSTVLNPVELSALSILSQLAPDELAAIKHILHLGLPAVVGAQTLHAFVALCASSGMDLTPAGIAAFKQTHGLDNTGDNRGAIGPRL